jgi:hypothetical protein
LRVAKVYCRLTIESFGGKMTSTVSPKNIGQYVQLAGIGAFVAGAILSVHHYAIGACIIAGAAAYYIGSKLKAQ